MNLALFTCLGLFAADLAPQADFAAANQRALDGDTAGSIALYRSLLERGVQNEDLYYNLGNTYAAAERPVDAIVAYAKGLRIAPGDADLRFNLAQIEASLLGAAAAPEETSESMAAAIEPWLSVVALETAAWIVLIANALFFAALFLHRWNRWRKLSTFIAAACGVLILGMGMALAGHALVRLEARAVVIEASELKEGPSPQFKGRGNMMAGKRVRILGKDGAWLKVQDRGGITGWLRSQYVTQL